jgi:GT2 family glycosyltransferase
MKSPNRTAIILVNWNGLAYLGNCLRSLRGLLGEFDIFMVDNLSSDGSVEFVVENFSEVTILRSHSNLGFSGGNNLALEKIDLTNHYAFYWLLNVDTEVERSALTEMIEKFDSSEKTGIVGSLIYDTNSDFKIQSFGGGNYSLITGNVYNYTNPVEDSRIKYIVGASMLVRREVYRRIGGLSEEYFMYWEDADYCARAVDAGYSLAVAEKSIVWHNISSSTKNAPLKFDQLFTKSAYVFFNQRSKNRMFPFNFLIGTVIRATKYIIRGQIKRSIHLIQFMLSTILKIESV